MVKTNKRGRSKSQSKSPAKSAKVAVNNVQNEKADSIVDKEEQANIIHDVEIDHMAHEKTYVVINKSTRGAKQTRKDTLSVEPLNKLVLRSQVIAPEISGIRCIAINSNHNKRNAVATTTNYEKEEKLSSVQEGNELLVARENGSFVLYKMLSFQNIVHFAPIRHTGGRVGVTITKIAYIHYCYDANHVSLIDANHNKNGNVNEDGIVPIVNYSTSQPLSLFVASYLSGQLVLYNGTTLFPIKLHQRTGGAIWDVCVSQCYLFTAMGDGSWHQLRLVCTKTTTTSLSSISTIHQGNASYTFDYELLRIVPSISGADRALCVHASLELEIVVGCDDSGNVNCWHPARTEQFYNEEELELHKNNKKSKNVKMSSENRRLTEHVSLWTRRLTDGMGLCVTTAGDVPSSLQSDTINYPVTSFISSSSSNVSEHVHFVAPIVAIGTSTGDVVLLHALHGHVLHIFSQHKGPVTTIIAHHNDNNNYIHESNTHNMNNANSNKTSAWSLYASGWHESIRCYRCDFTSSAENINSSSVSIISEWYPAEVKRRSHYHEAVQLLIVPETQLFLSASRDGTIMYNSLPSLFTQPAMYVNVCTQQFTLCPTLLTNRSSPLENEEQEMLMESGNVRKGECVNLLFQSRIDRVECFAASADLKHWNPLFAYKLSGQFHLNQLWCKGNMQHGQLSHSLPRFVVMSTDERVVIAQLTWKHKANVALLLKHIDEVVELPAGSGVIDAIFVSGSFFANSLSLKQHDAKLQNTLETVQTKDEQLNLEKNNIKTRSKTKNNSKAIKKTNSSKEVMSSGHVSSSYTRLYLLKDDEIIFVKLTVGFPVIRTSLVGDQTVSHANHQTSPIRPTQILFDQVKQQLLIFGLNGSITIDVNDDGTPCLSTMNINKQKDSVFMFVRQVPVIGCTSHELNENNNTTINSFNENVVNSTYNNNETNKNVGDIMGKREKVHSTLIGLAMHSSQSNSQDLTQTNNNSNKKHAGRYYAHINSDHPIALPRTLPHDTIFIAQVHPAYVHAFTQYSTLLFIARFSKGLMLVSEKDWKMVSRLSIEGAGLVCCARPSSITSSLIDNYSSNNENIRDIEESVHSGEYNNNSSKVCSKSTNDFIGSVESNATETVENETANTNIEVQHSQTERQQLQTSVDTRVLVLERNLEKTLESLPLCWKVRRFGN